MIENNKVVDALLGVAVGDALGVPFEFRSRLEMANNPATNMIGYGTYNLPKGTWSDDSSLTFCLAESLVNGYDLIDIADKFIAWKNENHWTPRGEVFDIGVTTSNAIRRLQFLSDRDKLGQIKLFKYQGDENENGNGALMRIMPLLFYIKGKTIEEQFEIIWDVSSLTHRHIRSAMCCLIYLKLAEHLLNGLEKVESYLKMQKEILAFWAKMSFAEREREHFSKFIQSDIRDVPKDEIMSGGYVMESIEASLWCFLKKENYSDTVFEAINFGHDTDTTAAIVGGLAGLYYGAKTIDENWIASLARLEDILELTNQLNAKYF